MSIIVKVVTIRQVILVAITVTTILALYLHATFVLVATIHWEIRQISCALTTGVKHICYPLSGKTLTLNTLTKAAIANAILLQRC